MKESYFDRIYAGWLAKIIGIRLGAPVEGWTYEQIREKYGTLTGYVQDYHEFAADDDSNGPLFFLRGLEDGGHGKDMTAQDVADALLNYAPYEHGFFWWGGYGISTEHTAYLNLRSGIPAPQSGSIQQNGSTIAEQIGGQIFIDTWGLVAPGNPDLAVCLAKRAASVTHDGNGVYGGMFVAACISWAFEESDIEKIIEKGLSYIPSDCEYTRVVRAVLSYWQTHKENTWEDAFHYVKAHFGYDRYPGNCHIIPNTAVMILALLYGEGDFDQTLTIGCMCGWDTDCNVGNIATIMGVRGGISAISEKWTRPVHDLLICSSVVGSLNIMDIPYGAAYITRLACQLASCEPSPRWQDVFRRIDSCHFEFPGSTHSLYSRAKTGMSVSLLNTEEAAHSGTHSLKMVFSSVEEGAAADVFRKTYYQPKDFTDSRYDPSFSPLVYPGQTLHASVRGGKDTPIHASVSLYARDLISGSDMESDAVPLSSDGWTELSYPLPASCDVLIGEMGIRFHFEKASLAETSKAESAPEKAPFTAYLDDFFVDGEPDYTMHADHLTEEVWTGLHREISQFSRLKGIAYLQDGKLHLSCADFAEVYTGRYDFGNYAASFRYTPLVGKVHRLMIRVQGAMRSYAAALLDGRAALVKNEGVRGYRELVSVPYSWKNGEEQVITIAADGNTLTADIGSAHLTYTDTRQPYLTGSIGLSTAEGSHGCLSAYQVKGIHH